jgi:carbon-monoxide dehydrogenase iron sulfur subunit
MERIFCDLRKCLACNACELACAVEHSSSKDLFQAVLQEESPARRREVQPAIRGNISLACYHCDPAPCVDACITGAMHKEGEATLVDQEKCVGCWMCVMACPFGVITPSKLKVALKCDLCPDREGREGRGRYACVEACPTEALFVGEFEEFEDLLKKEVATY